MIDMEIDHVVKAVECALEGDMPEAHKHLCQLSRDDLARVMETLDGLADECMMIDQAICETENDRMRL